MRMSRKGLEILLASMIAALHLNPCLSLAGDLEIRIREDVTIRGAQVTLRDIATFTPQSDPRVDSLGRIDVSSAPSPGNMVNLNRSFLNYKIGSAVEGKGKDIRLEIPEAVTIRRTANIIQADQLERIFKDHVRTHAAWDPEKIVFEKVDVPESVALPEGRIRWEILEKGSDRYLGHVALTVNFFVDGRQVRNVPVSGKVTVTQEVVKASRKISPGQVVLREDVHLAHEQSSYMQRDILTVPEDAVGKKAVRIIQAGQPIAAQMLENPPVIKKGTRVLITAGNKMIQVSAGGKAVEDGHLGEEVRVMNLSSGKEIHATVKGPGVVEVAF